MYWEPLIFAKHKHSCICFVRHVKNTFAWSASQITWKPICKNGAKFEISWWKLVLILLCHFLLRKLAGYNGSMSKNCSCGFNYFLLVESKYSLLIKCFHFDYRKTWRVTWDWEFSQIKFIFSLSSVNFLLCLTELKSLLILQQLLSTLCGWVVLNFCCS